MEKLKVELEHCYGIRKMSAEFDFSKKHANLIYAPNGAMKSSFAKTFQDLSSNRDSCDRIYKDRASKRFILDEDDNPIDPENIFVIEPYDAKYQSERISTLLVNKSLKDEYDQILKDIQNKQDELLKKVKKTSGINKGLEDVISRVFTQRHDNLLRAVDRVKTEVLEDPTDHDLENIKYADLFDERIVGLLKDDALKEALQDYTTTYDGLMAKSRFFRKGVFNHYQAGEIAKQLKNHGFFKADHKVSLNSGEEEVEVKTEAELEALISEELSTILSDEELKKKFDKIDKKISNQTLRDFREFLLSHQTLIPRLTNLDLLEQDLVKYYLMQHKDEFSELIVAYEQGRKRLEEISKEASEQATDWQNVINIFNRRFSVPFEVGIENKNDVILKRVTPNISFIFQDLSDEPASVTRDQLVDVLSNGELRALYILNIIFEVEARKNEGVKTLFVVDDIADSFDYKNKYAIVEYLGDILEEQHFRQIVLTHNYDFYRTVWKRLELGGATYHIAKTADEVKLSSEVMYKDPFQKWVAQANDTDNLDMLLAMIPFVRNLADYCGYEDESSRLTRLLHVKTGSSAVTLGELLESYGNLLNGWTLETTKDLDATVTPLILEEAARIASESEVSLDLEKKVVLSIAIRLLAEKRMIDLINDPKFCDGLKSNQTAKLLKRFKEKFHAEPSRKNLISVMDRVSLMTPENIHLNSFMFEPILDMSPEHLAKLHQDILAAG